MPRCQQRGGSEGTETEEKRDACVDEEEREQLSAVWRSQATLAILNERMKRMDEVTSGDKQRARIAEEIP
jgi:hypothetical protein